MHKIVVIEPLELEPQIVDMYRWAGEGVSKDWSDYGGVVLECVVRAVINHREF